METVHIDFLVSISLEEQCGVLNAVDFVSCSATANRLLVRGSGDD